MSTRTKKAMRNASVTGIVTVLTFPIQFITRYFLVHFLGIEYLGITGLYSNILSVLSLADLGLGASIVFLLYKPIKENDKKQLAIIMYYYKRMYQVIAVAILAVGILTIPMLHFFLGKAINYPHVYAIYVVYLLGLVSSYLFSYNQTLLYATQENHIISISNLIVRYIILIIQVITVVIYKDPVTFAVLTVCTSFLTNICVSAYVRSHYPYIGRNYGKLSKEDKTALSKNVIGNIFLRTSGVIVTGTDNLLLSAFAGIVQVGLYANYTTLTTFLRSVVAQIINATIGSIGEFSVSKTNSESVNLFIKLQFINFMMINLATLGLLFLSGDVITIWLGKSFVLSDPNTLLIALSFYFMNYRILGWNFIDVYGLAKFMKVFAMNEMIANMVFSLVFAWGFGMKLTGILLGTILSTLCTVSWQDPYVIFHHGFHTSPKIYFKKYAKNLMVLALEIMVLLSIDHVVNTFFDLGIAHFVTMLIAVVIVAMIFPFVCYRRSAELEYAYSIFKRLLLTRK